MKIIISKVIFFTILNVIFSGIIYSEVFNYDPLLVVTIMIKDEEHSIEKTLQPFLELHDPRIGYLILDTGSTDNTVQVTLNTFEKYNAENAYLFQKPFVDFSVSRNDTIKFAEEMFKNAAFFLMIDAEWYVQNVPYLLEFCEQYKDHPDNAFFLKIGNSYFENFLPRLFKPHRNIYFKGVVHEYLNTKAFIKLPSKICAIYDPSSKGQQQSHSRCHRDVQLLYEEHKKNPTDPRTTFYLAQTYFCLQDFENALHWYTIRIQQDGGDQENYMALYLLAKVYEHLQDWPNALFYFIKAYNMRPWRVEPLIEIATHYLQQFDYAAAFIFARQAVNVKANENEFLFINTFFYDVIRYDILAVAAFHVGEYEIGKKALLQALQANPKAPHLQFYLALYNQNNKRS